MRDPTHKKLFHVKSCTNKDNKSYLTIRSHNKDSFLSINNLSKMIELLFICCLIIICGLFLVKHLLFYLENKSIKELFDKLPQIKPHWFYGNSSSDHVYKAMKGLHLAVWFTGRKRQLFIMDPDLIHKIVVTDFNHFVDSAFLDPDYSKVSF